MGCVCVYIQKGLCYWWGYGDEKTRIEIKIEIEIELNGCATVFQTVQM